jgi:hypothetical protein
MDIGGIMKRPVSVAVLAFLMGAAHAADEPSMKEGYWSIHTVTNDQSANGKQESTRTICRNHAYDEHVRELAKKTSANCKTIAESSSGGTRTTETECTVAGRVIHTKGMVTTNGENAAHSEARTTYAPPMGGISESAMIMDQKYLGACPAGIEPGDIVGADGKKITSWRH